MNNAKELISIIIPCFNEEKTLNEVVARIHAAQVPRDYEIVVIDDCSTDKSVQIAELLLSKRLIDKLKVHNRNLGKGAAIRTGIEVSSGSIVLIQDADLEYSPADYSNLLAPILEGSAQVVYGSRYISPTIQNGVLFHRTLANKFLTRLSNTFTGLELSDMETCYKIFRKHALKTQILKENRFGFEPEFTALVARQNLNVVELPISYFPRTKAEGKKIGFKDGLRAIWVIVFCGLQRNKGF